MPLTPRSTEVILADYGRRNANELERVRIGEHLNVPDVGELEVTDIVYTAGDYDSYDYYTSAQRFVIVRDESGRLFRFTLEESSYSSAVSVIDVKHVVAKPVDRIDYINVKH